MEPQRKKIRLLSSTESKSSLGYVTSSHNRKDINEEADMETEWPDISGYDSDGNSSVESMDIIRYPSASVLWKIENKKSYSEEAERKNCSKEKLKDIPKKSLTGKSKKSKISAKHPKNKGTFNKTVKAISIRLSKSSKTISIDYSKTSNKLEYKNVVQRTVVNNAYVSLETKNSSSISITKENKTPNRSQSSAKNKENGTVCKKPRLYQSLSNKEEGYLSNCYEESDAATCSYVQENPDINKTKKSTVKKRPENYGSRLNPLLTDFKSHANKSQSSEEIKQRIIKSKHQWQIKYKDSEKNSKTEIHDHNSNSQSAKNDLGTKSILDVGKQEEQSSTELLYSNDSNNEEELPLSSNFYNLPQMSTSNLENSSDKQFHKTASQPGNSLGTLHNYPKESPGINRNISSNYSLNLIKIIVDLDTKWLEEKESRLIRKPPPNFEIEEGMKLPLSFKSFDEYHTKYLSMLKLEVWEKICSSTKSNLNHTSKSNFTFSVDSYDYDVGQMKLMRLHCKSAIYAPTENSLVILNLKLEDGQLKSTFGFIEQFECKNKDHCETNDRHHKAPVKQLVFKMLVKSRTISPKKEFQMEGKFVCSLYKEMKQAEALHLMKFSPLLKEFLKPSWDLLCTSHKRYNGDFFDVQQNIFDTVSQEINISLSPKVMLLQGPPGSGKTSAIVSIASNLLRNKEDLKKILIVAPSHSALDEIGNQLLKLNELFVNPINFVRLGQIENINIKLLDYSLHRYLEKYRMSYKYNYKSLNSNLKTMEEISTRSGKTCKSSRNEKSKKWSEQSETIKNEIFKDQLKQKILSEASLILAVSEDCWELHQFKVKFSCCLIDDVNQSTELDVLYPFALGITKFLLVADHNQLPANVKSEMAQNSGYRRSLMERFQSCIKNEYRKNPTIVLSQQFRFNSLIADFPFRHFYMYSACRERCSYADKRSGFYPFRPYVVLDDRRHYGSKDLLYAKEIGVNFVLSLCSYIIDKDATSSIGIIVPSEEEQRAYNAAIVNIFSSDIVEVKTVDHFQGREKTVVILSCYHDFKEEVPTDTNYFKDLKKLNVALTRAISSLIICGSLHEPMKYKIWSDIVSDSQNRGCYFQFKSLDEVHLSRILNNSNA